MLLNVDVYNTSTTKKHNKMKKIKLIKWVDARRNISNNKGTLLYSQFQGDIYT